jgi:hypothetical protein
MIAFPLVVTIPDATIGTASRIARCDKPPCHTKLLLISSLRVKTMSYEFNGTVQSCGKGERHVIGLHRATVDWDRR